MDAVIIRRLNLPIDCKALTILDDNGDYNIYLNARYSADTQAVALREQVKLIQTDQLSNAGYNELLNQQAL